MNAIIIIGASQRTYRNAADEWGAVYFCHKCGDEFAASSAYCKSEEDARKESDTQFNKQQRRFCHLCGYKLTSSDPAPDNEYIQSLNNVIDNLLKKIQELSFDNKTLHDCLSGFSDAERIAISRGWIKAVPVYEDEEEL